MTVLWVSLLLLQDKGAEEAFRGIEEKIDKAPALKVRFSADLVGTIEEREEKAKVRGRVALEGLRKFQLTLNAVGVMGEKNLAMACDGAKVRVTADGRTTEEEIGAGSRDPALFDALVRSTLSRAGMCMTFFLFRNWAPAAEKGATDFKKMFEVSDLKSGEDDGGARTLTYRLKVGGEVKLVDCKLWYHAGTLKPVKRVATLDLRVVKAVFTETYEEFDLGDAEAPASPVKRVEEAPLTDDQVMKRFIVLEIRFAREFLKAGKKEQAVKTLEELARKYPDYPETQEARRLLEELKK